MNKSLWIAFFAFCLLSSAAWLMVPAVPSGLPSLERQWFVYAAVSFAVMLVRGRGMWLRVRERAWGRVALGGVVLLSAPVGLIRWAGGSVSTVNASAAFALLPAVVVVVMGSSAEEEGGGRRLLAPALTAFGGVLLLLPVDLPGSVRGWITLGAVCVAMVGVAIGGVWMHQWLRDLAIGDAVFLICGANAMFLLWWGLLDGSSDWGWGAPGPVVSIASLVNVVEVLLLIWLLQRMSPVFLAARYVVVPLLTVIEGYVVLRPELTARMGVGAVLVAAGSGWIFLSNDAEDEVGLSLR